MSAGRRGLLGMFALALCTHGWAIDNPDAPDRMADFKARAAPWEAALANTDGGSAAAHAGGAYLRFLEAELNHVHAELLSRLRPDARRALRVAQRRWLRWRESELSFMRRQWTAERSGSSWTLSLAEARTRLTKDRVVLLLSYLGEYPDAPR